MLACFGAPPAFAAHYLRLDNGNRLHWPSTSSFSKERDIPLYDSTASTTNGSRWRNWLGDARYDWSRSSLIALSMSRTGGDSYNCPFNDYGIKVCSYSSYPGSYAGVAEFILVYGHMRTVRVRLDDEGSGLNYPNDSCLAPPADEPGSCATYAHAVTCQEVGHALGLGHTGGATCMGNGYFADSAYEVHPNGHDYDALGTSTGHFDASPFGTSSAEDPSASGAPEGEGDSQSNPQSESAREGMVVKPPPEGDCSRKQVGRHTFVERVCGPERRGEDEIRIIDYIPAVTQAAP